MCVFSFNLVVCVSELLSLYRESVNSLELKIPMKQPDAKLGARFLFSIFTFLSLSQFQMCLSYVLLLFFKLSTDFLLIVAYLQELASVLRVSLVFILQYFFLF